MRAFTSFGDGHGVWEKSGGALLPFYARNLRDVTQWAAPLEPHRSDADAPELQTARLQRRACRRRDGTRRLG